MEGQWNKVFDKRDKTEEVEMDRQSVKETLAYHLGMSVDALDALKKDGNKISADSKQDLK